MKVYAIMEECDDQYYEPHLATPIIFFTKEKAEKTRENIAKKNYNSLYTWIEELELK